MPQLVVRDVIDNAPTQGRAVGTQSVPTSVNSSTNCLAVTCQDAIGYRRDRHLVDRQLGQISRHISRCTLA